jgi:hypothetical protein
MDHKNLDDNTALIGFDVDLFAGVVSMLEDAIRRCREAGGDSRLRLELFLIHVVRRMSSLLYPQNPHTNNRFPRFYTRPGFRSKATTMIRLAGR